MTDIVFIFNSIPTTIQCKKDDYMKDICQKFATKVGADLSDTYFLYGGKVVDLKLKLDNILSENDKKSNNIKILVYSNDTKDDNLNNIEYSKEIICPKCGKICLINFQDFKISISGCKDNHNLKDMALKEFENSQKIDSSKIICKDCKNNNKKEAYNFYVCLTCKKDLCPLCMSKSHKEHDTIEYDKKNYICNVHNESFNSFCQKCNDNLCMFCESEHKDKENMIDYRDILPKKDILKTQLNGLKNIFNKFKQRIKEITDILESINANIEIYYNINDNLIKNFEKKYRNFQILKNMNMIINNNSDFLNKLETLVNENKIVNFFDKTMNMFKIINSQPKKNEEQKKDDNNIIQQNKEYSNKKEKKENKNINENNIMRKADIDEEVKTLNIKFDKKRIEKIIDIKQAKSFYIEDIKIKNTGNNAIKNIYLIIDEKNSSNEIKFLDNNNKESNVYKIVMDKQFEPNNTKNFKINLNIKNPKPEKIYKMFIFINEKDKVNPKSKILYETLEISVKISHLEDPIKIKQKMAIQICEKLKRDYPKYVTLIDEKEIINKYMNDTFDINKYKSSLEKKIKELNLEQKQNDQKAEKIYNQLNLYNLKINKNEIIDFIKKQNFDKEKAQNFINEKMENKKREDAEKIYNELSRLNECYIREYRKDYAINKIIELNFNIEEVKKFYSLSVNDKIDEIYSEIDKYGIGFMDEDWVKDKIKELNCDIEQISAWVEEELLN